MDFRGKQDQEGRYLLHSPLCFALLWLTPACIISMGLVRHHTVSDHSRSDGQQILRSLLLIFGHKSFPKSNMWYYTFPQDFTKVSLILGINTRQNKDTDNKIGKGKSLFCKNCCELHNLVSSMILLDTLANYGSLFLLLSLLILLTRAFLASRGHCPHHARCHTRT